MIIDQANWLLASRVYSNKHTTLTDCFNCKYITQLYIKQIITP